MPTPLLILSDAPASSTGLGRICRELATRIAIDLPEVFRVGTFGFGATTSQKLPFVQYPMTVTSNYVAPELPAVWEDFAGEGKGIILTIWNPSWVRWLVDPASLPDSRLKRFLAAGKFQTWGYFPIDGIGADGLLPKELVDVIDSFDRKLAYTGWGSAVLSKCLGESIPRLPHGLDIDVFRPYDKQQSRENFFTRLQIPGVVSKLSEEILLLGVIATNTPRKDWGLAFQVCRSLRDRGHTVGLWCHTDAPRKAWDLSNLALQSGMEGRYVVSTAQLSDEDMARCYSACDVTLAIGSGEGWGYPIAESLACGVPVVHGDYAGGAELGATLVSPRGWRLEGIYGIQRPVYSPDDWANTIEQLIQVKAPVELPKHIQWSNAWPRWKEWLLAGVGQ